MFAAPMLPTIQSITAKLEIISSRGRPRPGLGLDVRCSVLWCAVNASFAYSVAAASGAPVVGVESSRWRTAFLPASEARICCYSTAPQGGLGVRKSRWRTRFLRASEARICCYSRAQGGLAMAWACPRCTYLNQGAGAVCGMCAFESPAPVVDSGPEWSCPSCTFLNHFVESSCEMCNTARPELSELERTNSAGGKFRPLRAPHRSNADKERSHEAADASSGPGAAAVPNDLHSFVKESDMVSRKRKAAAVDDEEGLNSNEMDGFREKPASPGDGEVPNRLLGELHAQRMARINKSMASSDLEKDIQQNHGQALSALAVDSSSAQAQRTTDATTAGPCRDAVDAIDTIVILTYNVWFREDLELQARMNAIGKIIQLRQPHVICLQEVTPNIYSVLQKSTWWSLYECSVTPNYAPKRAYFCVQLSRLSVSAFHRNPYSNSVMGRELAMADLDFAPGEQIVVATTHLESPCPAPPTWNQMFSKERVFQANEALKLMKDLPNVVFGGDMNWDDKLDGQPPLPPGWFDAWLKHRRNQPGLTYDSKANPMLGGSRLQKRLDRVFCHLRDFKVESIEMVGTQPIAGLTYEKERKLKGQVQLTTLPVLPSDHFGLLLILKRIIA